MVNGGEREGDGGDGDGTRRTQVREEPAAHDRTPCVQPATQEGGRGRHARSGAAGGGDRTKGIARGRQERGRRTEEDKEGATETR